LYTYIKLILRLVTHAKNIDTYPKSNSAIAKTTAHSDCAMYITFLVLVISKS